jgi:HD-GYP domain-containing protein (c-di-GMP phosphodiesterase class II)
MTAPRRENPHQPTQGEGTRWRSRPILSTAIRFSTVLAPAIAAALVAIAISRWLPVPRGTAETAAWWGLFLAATVATWLIFASLLYRLLPLATLLDLTLLFPDSAPSRFAVLRRTANPRQLERGLLRAQEIGPGTEPARRAQVILELAAALSVHDSRTRGHSERVRMFTDLLAQELRLEQGDSDRLRWAALLHDIGKLTLAPELLNKPARPEPEEWVAIHRHPMEGHRLIAPLHEWLGTWADAVRDHHERFDGTGYPQGLRGQAISQGGRIVAVADSYETMTAARPYKRTMSVKAAREELVRMSGSHFDPVIVRAFLNISLGRLWQTVGFGALLFEIPLLAPVAWRISRIGPRSISAMSATAATTVVLVAGLAGPPAAAYLYGAGSTELPIVHKAAAPAPLGGPTGPAAVPSPGVISVPPASSTTTSLVGPGSSSAGSTSAAAPGGVSAPSFPAGITRKSSLPPGIAKNPSAFTNWRKNH